MRRINRILYLSVTGLAVCLSQQLSAITVQELHELMENGEKLTIIDVRSFQDYKNNHVPNAISIPGRIINGKQMPPLGEVVVYGDGIDEAASNAAANALNQKKGIHAQILEGGIAAWQSQNLPDTRTKGMIIESMRFISYQELSKVILNNPDIILVDLRRAQAKQSLTDIEVEMPDVQIIRPVYLGNRKNKKGFKYQLRSLFNNQEGPNQPFYILIDNGGETAEKVYRKLRARGLKRLAILAGGERILNRHGQSGQGQRIIKSGELK